MDTAQAIRPQLKKQETIINRHLRRLQRIHFAIFDIIPFLCFLLVIGLQWWYPINGLQIGLVLGMWFLTGGAISVGFHRYFSHRGFKTGKFMSSLFIIFGSMAAQGPMISWASIHRRHHEKSDLDGDPHSPNQHGQHVWGRIRGLWHAHFSWMINHEYPNPAHYVPDLLKNKSVAKHNRQYLLWVIIGLLLPTAIAALVTRSATGTLLGFLWGGPVRIFLVDHIIWSVNSVCHMFGTAPFNTQDLSRNNYWLAIPTMGESLQNNHHAFPNSPSIGLVWWQLDIGAMLIRGLAAVGLVWDLKLPSPSMIAAKRIAKPVPV